MRTYSIPVQEFYASKVAGYSRSFFLHDTGGEYNYVVATTYPDWDYVRGPEMRFGELLEEFKAANNVPEADTKNECRRHSDGRTRDLRT